MDLLQVGQNIQEETRYLWNIAFKKIGSGLVCFKQTKPPYIFKGYHLQQN